MDMTFTDVQSMHLSTATFRKTLSAFNDFSVDIEAKLTSAFENDSLEEYERAVHSFKSTIAFLCLPQAFDHLSSIEGQVAKVKASEFHQFHNDVLGMLSDVKEATNAELQDATVVIY